MGWLIGGSGLCRRCNGWHVHRLLGWNLSDRIRSAMLPFLCARFLLSIPYFPQTKTQKQTQTKTQTQRESDLHSESERGGDDEINDDDDGCGGGAKDYDDDARLPPPLFVDLYIHLFVIVLVSHGD